MSKKKKQYIGCQRRLLYLLMVGVFFASGCKDEVPESPIVIPGTSIQCLKLNVSSAHHMEEVQTTTNVYKLTTTGNDPYIFSQELTKTLNKDSVVLAFEYKSSAEVNFLQIFFGPGISESRSIKIGFLSQTTS